MAGIYISWPFCAQKCTFCNFASGVQPGQLEQRYLRGLTAEIQANAWEWTPETLYLGGGTPSSMHPNALASVFEGIPAAALREATIEAAPGSFDSARVQAWRALGIDRVSLGVQSFVKSELARTGRKHDAAIVANDVETLRSHGIDDINIDLIAGLPGQTTAGWRHSVESAIRLGVPHVSVYMLEVDEESRLGAEILLGGKRYGASDVPDEDRVASFYEDAVLLLAENGIARYEISNFARPGFESKHNLKYWKLEPYVGFGADAHSFDGRTRWQNPETAVAYVAHWEQGRPARQESTAAKAEEEKFFVGLRLAAGVLTDEADWQRHGRAFERFLSIGMMERSGDVLRLTPRGMMVSNEVFEEFLTA